MKYLKKFNENSNNTNILLNKIREKIKEENSQDISEDSINEFVNMCLQLSINSEEIDSLIDLSLQKNDQLLLIDYLSSIYEKLEELEINELEKLNTLTTSERSQMDSIYNDWLKNGKIMTDYGLIEYIFSKYNLKPKS